MLSPGHGAGSDALTAVALFFFLALVGYLLPVGVARLFGIERLSFMERSLPILRVTQLLAENGQCRGTLECAPAGELPCGS